MPDPWREIYNGKHRVHINLHKNSAKQLLNSQEVHYLMQHFKLKWYPFTFVMLYMAFQNRGLSDMKQ